MTTIAELLSPIEKRLAAATPTAIGQNYIERLEGHSDDSFRYEVRTPGGFVAFYEDNYDEPMRAKFDSELFAASATDLSKLIAALKIIDEAFHNILKKNPNAVGINEAADMSVEFHMGIHAARANIAAILRGEK